jgi:hypothetical protein
LIFQWYRSDPARPTEPATQEAAMADKTSTPRSRNGGGRARPAPPAEPTDTDAVESETTGAVQPSKKSKRRLRRLGKDLDAARATEARRLRQSVKAHQKADKRERQVARASADVTAILGRIAEAAGDDVARKPPAVATPAPGPAPKPAKSSPSRRTARPAPSTPPPPVRRTTKPRPEPDTGSGPAAPKRGA